MVPQPPSAVSWNAGFFVVLSHNIVPFREDFPGARLVSSRSGTDCEWRLELLNGQPHAHPLRVGTTRAPFWLRLRRAVLLRGGVEEMRRIASHRTRMDISSILVYFLHDEACLFFGDLRFLVSGTRWSGDQRVHGGFQRSAIVLVNQRRGTPGKWCVLECPGVW